MSIDKRSISRARNAALLAGVACLASAGPIRAATFNILNDTYIDSYYYSFTDPNSGVVTTSTNQRTNYGKSQVVKVVTSAASLSFPAPSTVRTLFTLPNSFWTALGINHVSSAIVTYTARTDSSLANRTIELHPLTHPFVAGTGGTPSSTMGGGDNTATSGPYGADWQTYDGTNLWGSAGSDYDSASYVNDGSVQSVTSGGSTFHVYSWDIASLIDNPATRAEMQSDGLMLKLVNDGEDPDPQQFASLYSADGATSNNSSIEQPTASFVVPEPASLSLLAVVCAAGLSRRHRSNGAI